MPRERGDDHAMNKKSTQRRKEGHDGERKVVIEKEKEVCNADCVTVIQSAYKTVLEITIQSSHKAGAAGAIFPLIMYTPLQINF